MNREKINKLLVSLFFVPWIIAPAIPKRTFQMFYIVAILIFTLLFIKNRYVIFNNTYLNNYSRIYANYFKCFIFISGVYLLLSFLNLPQFWEIDSLLFDPSYIYRHFLIIVALFLPLGLSIAIYNCDFIVNINTKTLILFLLFSIIIIYFYHGIIIIAGLIAAIISLIAVKTNNNIYLLFIPFIFVNQTAYLIAAATLITLFLTKNTILHFLGNNTKSKIVILLLFIALVITLFSGVIYRYLQTDENGMWRLMVWKNELSSLYQTVGTGVGFGSAYVTTDFYRYIDNSNMYYDNDGTLYDGLFLVANHNTFLNMFYRMGIIGGLLFILLTIQVIVWTIQCCLNCDENENINYLWWGLANFLYNTIIILLNPGLEMMQFAINYLSSLACLYALLLKFNFNNDTI